MVLAGTQGGFNHKKTDRLISIAKEGIYQFYFLLKVVVEDQEMWILMQLTQVV